MIEYTHVDGMEKGDVKLFALSTCVWCKRTKKLLSNLGVAYDYVFVDELEGDEKEEVTNAVKVHNPRCSYPTLVINNEICVVGFKEELIREHLDN